MNYPDSPSGRLSIVVVMAIVVGVADCWTPILRVRSTRSEVGNPVELRRARPRTPPLTGCLPELVVYRRVLTGSPS